MKRAIIEFIDFIKYPQQTFRSNHKVCIFILCGIIMLLLNIFALIISFVYGYFRLDLPEKLLFYYDEKYFLYTLLLVPFFEEMAFRLYLIPKRWNIWLSSVFVIWSLYPWAINAPESPVEYMIIRCLVSLSIGFLAFLVLRKIVPNIKYPYLFYFSALFFGIMHFHTFIYDNVSFFSILYILLYIIMMTFSGVLFGYIRVSLGIIYSIIFHFLMNFLPVMAAFGKL
jgi:membrane protease YdiL (CAAX protease family)